MAPDEYLQINRKVYDSMVAADDPLCRPATDEELADPLGTVDGAGWLGPSIEGRNLLCLAAGGGRQSSLYAAAGAKVTVVDLSGAMLELDRQVATQRGLSLRLFEASMDNLVMFREAEFDIVIHPVSTCYVPDIRKVFSEVARVSRADAIYISQHKQPSSLQSSTEPSPDGLYRWLHSYYRGGSDEKKLPQVNKPIPPSTSSSRATRRLRETGAIEYLHRWEDIIGGMCHSGFVIENFCEPCHAKPDAEIGSFSHRAAYIPPYVRIKARRIKSGRREDKLAGSLWLPGS